MSRTVDEIIAEMRIFTLEQRSLAWMPEPANDERSGASDCRPGGSCGIDLDAAYSTQHGRWRRARFRWNREQKKMAEVQHA